MISSRCLRPAALLATLFLVQPFALHSEGARPGSVTKTPSPQQIHDANAAVHGEGVVFPVDSGVLNVKAFGAKGDGLADDTAAIQAAYDNSGMIYFPEGTYLVTDQIKAPPRKGSAAARRVIQGQSRKGTVIKLQDNASGFDGTKPKSVLVVSWGVAQAFHNAVRDVTIDVGTGNPGAVGLEFFASNQGAVRGVTIQSSDPQRKGSIGLLLKGDNGPLLVNDLRVVGFDTGIESNANALAVLKDIELQDQSAVGIAVKNRTFIHGLTSRNAVTAVKLEGPPAVLLNATLTAGDAGAAGIEYVKGNALLRDITADGYAAALAGPGAPNGTAVEEWTSAPPVAFVGNLTRTLDLPQKEVPEVAWGAPETWRGIAADGNENSVEQIQAVLDSGASTVYFSSGEKITAFGTVTVPPSVQRIIGLEAALRGQKNQNTPGLEIVIEEGSNPLVIEHFDNIYNRLRIFNKSARPLIVRSLHAETIDVTESTADLFIEDVVGNFLNVKGQSVWAWQYNIEAGVNIQTGEDSDTDPGPRRVTLDPLPRAAIQNAGGNLFLFGMKTEKNRTKVWSTNGAQSECYAYVMANWAYNPLPIFISEDSKFSAFLNEGVRRDAPYEIVLAVKCGNDAKELKGTSPSGSNFSLLTAECP